MSPKTRRTIVARHHGWEGASPSLLARVFDSTPQRITAICAQTCARCSKAICGCTDDQWLSRDGAETPVTTLGAILEVDRAQFSHPERTAA